MSARLIHEMLVLFQCFFSVPATVHVHVWTEEKGFEPSEGKIHIRRCIEVIAVGLI